MQNLITKIKWFTLLKGFIWELIGIAGLFIWLLITTDSPVNAIGKIAIGYPLIRALTWYFYERAFKHFKRKWYNKIVVRKIAKDNN